MANYPVDVILLQIAWEASNPAVRMGGKPCAVAPLPRVRMTLRPSTGYGHAVYSKTDIPGLTILVGGACTYVACRVADKYPALPESLRAESRLNLGELLYSRERTPK